MNRLEILQKVYGDFVWSESALNHLMAVMEETVRECINQTLDIQLVGIHSEDYEQGVWEGIQMCQNQIKRHFNIK